VAEMIILDDNHI